MDGRENGDYVNEKRGGKPVAYTLEELNSILSKISMTMTKLELVLMEIIVKRTMREIVFNENRKVLELIKKLQGYVNQIESVIVLFENKAPRTRLQSKLNITLASLANIKSCLLSLYALKNEHDVEQYNPAIKNIALTAQARVRTVLEELQRHVDDYNKENPQKLNFKIKWVTLKEDEE